MIRAQAREVDRILSAWVRGQALCCLILALYYASALTVAGLDLGLIVGIAAGLLSFIPYVGSITGGVTALGLAMAQFPHWRGVIVVGGVLVVGQILEGYVIYPRFLGDRVELPAVWVIFALFAGGAAFGFVGVMLAVPVAATIGVLCRFWLRRYLASPLYLDPPSQAVADYSRSVASVWEQDATGSANRERKPCPAILTLRSEWEPRVLSIVRIVAGLLFWSTAWPSCSAFPTADHAPRDVPAAVVCRRHRVARRPAADSGPVHPRRRVHHVRRDGDRLFLLRISRGTSSRCSTAATRRSCTVSSSSTCSSPAAAAGASTACYRVAGEADPERGQRTQPLLSSPCS